MVPFFVLIKFIYKRIRKRNEREKILSSIWNKISSYEYINREEYDFWRKESFDLLPKELNLECPYKTYEEYLLVLDLSEDEKEKRKAMGKAVDDLLSKFWGHNT